MKTGQMQTINATDFKARCLALLDRVAETGEPVVILKRGRPVAELGPAVRAGDAYPQYELRGTVVETGDILALAVPADDWESARR